ncbi:latent transforming growth factor beta-binding protein [Sorangium sp. So ce302]|uniref:latent transforming growth factor beta-binding protein n=1 Tax=unclassified Sorangium TaxID=2621164 RepID=UPI003F636AA5
MRVRHVMITAAIAGLFAACASSQSDDGKTEPPVYGTVCEARCACEDCSGDEEGLCEAEEEAIAKRAEERCQDEHAAYIDCVRLEGRCVDGHHLAEVCNAHAAALQGCLDPTGHCPSADDGICDEPQGTGKCPAGTDPADCLSSCPLTGNGTCDEPQGTGRCPAGTDVDDCKLAPCDRVQDGACDEPEGTGLCAEGTDVADCAVGAPCASTNNGECDEPEGTGLCEEGTDLADCNATLACDDLDECGSDTSGCIGCAVQGSCADELDACTLNDDCILFAQCAVTCEDGDDACFTACMDRHPDGARLYLDYDTCVNCDECYYSCGNASILGC